MTANRITILDTTTSMDASSSLDTTSSLDSLTGSEYRHYWNMSRPTAVAVCFFAGLVTVILVLYGTYVLMGFCDRLKCFRTIDMPLITPEHVEKVRATPIVVRRAGLALMSTKERTQILERLFEKFSRVYRVNDLETDEDVDLEAPGNNDMKEFKDVLTLE